jgi:hypothetical protein
MKQYTSPDQTAKLIELGFEKPKSVLLYAQSVDCDNNYGWRGEVKYICDYTIGELIEMLPQVIEFGEKWVFYPLRVMPTVGGGWAISYCNEYDERNNELIDALYNMIIRLKEEGVI